MDSNAEIARLRDALSLVRNAVLQGVHLDDAIEDALESAPKHAAFPDAVMVKCSRCKGCGMVAANGVYRKTWAVLSQSGEVTGAQLARIVGCQATAMNNRLRRLETLGLATGRWNDDNGREYLWRAVQ